MNKRRVAKPVNAIKVTCDGIKFQSKLERYTYLALKAAGVYAGYENECFTIIDDFEFTSDSYERQANGKGHFTNRGNKKSLGIRYTPDFCSDYYIIECKGRANATFPMRYKLFKRHLVDVGDKRPLFKPQNNKEVDEVIILIKKLKNG